MPVPVHIERVFDLPFQRRDLWTILSKTDWINRSVGLPAVQYSTEPLPQGGSAITARARIFGVRLCWREMPFEWLEPEFHRVRRVFVGGPLAEGRMGMEFRSESAGQTRVVVFLDFEARNSWGAWLARTVLGPKTMRSMTQIMEHVREHLQGRTRVVLPNLPRQAVAESSLETGLKLLRQTVPDASLIVNLEELLRNSPDVALSHIRPLSVAKAWGRDKWDVLRTFLHATRSGLLDFSWEILCPNCRSTRDTPGTSLAQLRRTSHCDVCQIKFDGEFDRSVELKFAVNPSIRPRDEQTFCLAGPGGKPHVVSQVLVPAGARSCWRLPPMSQSYRLRSPQVRAVLNLSPGANADRLFDSEIICSAEALEIRPGQGSEGENTTQVFNPNPFPVQLSLEEASWSDEILTAAQVTNWQEFRDLFDAEVISPNEQITVGAQIVLFTDLRGSTALYNGIGDAPAYVLVRDHFRVLTDAIRQHHGAVVKTIGDAVMAVFSRVDEALSAVHQMHRELIPELDQHSKGSPLSLKSSLHIGACLAVNANDKLDFFGTTVNLAARMVGCCQGGDLTISDDLHQRPETTEFLIKTGKQGEASEVKFRGFETAHRVWRISMAP